MRESGRREMKAVKNLIIAACMVFSGCGKPRSQPQHLEVPAHSRHAAPVYSTVPGSDDAVREADLLTEPLPSLHSALKIRSITVTPQETNFPVKSEMLLEVQSGDLITIDSSGQRERHPGEMWLVPKGSRVRVRASREFTVLRSIDLVPPGTK